VTDPTYQTLRVRVAESICFVQISRPQANNTINRKLIEEFTRILDFCEREMTAVVIEGLPEVFCCGADFAEIQDPNRGGEPEAFSAQGDAEVPARLYDLWARLTSDPYVVIAHVRGRAIAGGVGFVAASDIVVAGGSATFSLSELLFGLMPACVLPFLVRRIGFQRAHYMTVSAQPIGVSPAASWGLVDVYEEDSEPLLRKQLLRVRCLSKTAIGRYKRYSSSLRGSMTRERQAALAANREVFSDPVNIASIRRYVETGALPWERR